MERERVDASLFSGENLLDAGRNYHRVGVNRFEPDTEWEELVLDSPRGVTQAVEFLARWGAIRGRAGWNRSRAVEVFEAFINDHADTLDQLSPVNIVDMQEADFDSVFMLAEALRADAPPTALGKFLHFELPRAVAPWDDEYVRTRYNLNHSSQHFVNYQRYCQRIAMLLVSQGGERAIERILGEHGSQTHCRATLPKLIDELVYDDEGNLERAMLAAGGTRSRLHATRQAIEGSQEPSG